MCDKHLNTEHIQTSTNKLDAAVAFKAFEVAAAPMPPRKTKDHWQFQGQELLEQNENSSITSGRACAFWAGDIWFAKQLIWGQYMPLEPSQFWPQAPVAFWTLYIGATSCFSTYRYQVSWSLRPKGTNWLPSGGKVEEFGREKYERSLKFTNKERQSHVRYPECPNTFGLHKAAKQSSSHTRICISTSRVENIHSKRSALRYTKEFLEILWDPGWSRLIHDLHPVKTQLLAASDITLCHSFSALPCAMWHVANQSSRENLLIHWYLDHRFDSIIDS